MAELTSLVAQPREGAGKGASRSLRRSGRVPGVIYGEKAPQEMVSLEARELRRAMQGARFFSTLCSLQVNGEAVRVLPREVQLHPVTDEPLHVDFVRVGRGATITVTIPVVFAHEDISLGLKRGGVLNIVRRELELLVPGRRHPARDRGRPEATPTSATACTSVTWRCPKGVRPAITDRDFTIATISAPTVFREEEEEAEAAEEAAEEEGREREAAKPEETAE